jgi:hypothetical protein
VSTLPPAPPPPAAWQPPSLSPAARVRAAYAQRPQSDYIFTGPGLNVFLTIITCGVFGFFLFYQLMRRDRDHNRRRLELLDGANAFAWEQATGRGVADELRPAFERIAASLDVLRRLTTEFRDPAIWLVIDIVAGGARLLGAGVAQIIGFILIDRDLDTHDRAEGAIEADLCAIYARFGVALPNPDPARVKGQQNYVARVIVSVVTCGIYLFWWIYDMQVEGNRHLEGNWPFDDAVAGAVDALGG